MESVEQLHVASYGLKIDAANCKSIIQTAYHLPWNSLVHSMQPCYGITNEMLIWGHCILGTCNEWHLKIIWTSATFSILNIINFESNMCDLIYWNILTHTLHYNCGWNIVLDVWKHIYQECGFAVLIPCNLTFSEVLPM